MLQITPILHPQVHPRGWPMANEHEGSRRLTQAAVEKLLPQPARRDIYDADVPGLVLRITPTGTKSWSFTYRLRGQAKRLTLGAFPGVNLKLARDRAREARAALQRGGDPVQKKKDAEREAIAYGFESCVSDFVEALREGPPVEWSGFRSHPARAEHLGMPNA